MSAYPLLAEGLPELTAGLVLGTILAIVAPMAVIAGAFMAVGRFREQLAQLREQLVKYEKAEALARQAAEKRIASLERWRERVRGREEITGVHAVYKPEDSGEH